MGRGGASINKQAHTGHFSVHFFRPCIKLLTNKSTSVKRSGETLVEQNFTSFVLRPQY